MTLLTSLNANSRCFLPQIICKHVLGMRRVINQVQSNLSGRRPPVGEHQTGGIKSRDTLSPSEHQNTAAGVSLVSGALVTPQRWRWWCSPDLTCHLHLPQCVTCVTMHRRLHTWDTSSCSPHLHASLATISSTPGALPLVRWPTWRLAIGPAHCRGLRVVSATTIR